MDNKKCNKKQEQEIAKKAKYNSKVFLKFINSKTKLRSSIPNLYTTKKPDADKMTTDDHQKANILGELLYGRKKIFFTVLYRSPYIAAGRPAFDIFLSNIETLSRISELKTRMPCLCGTLGKFLKTIPHGFTQAM